jgi:hypothetical protein
MVVPADYVILRNKIKFDEVSLGSTRVYLFKDNEIEEAQIGYGIDNKGSSLTGTVEGYWKESWLVIAYEDLCGDPIFIDIHKKGFPVYTAIHGEGTWDPENIATSFENFTKALTYIIEISKDRENPVKLENNPLSVVEKESVLKRIHSDNEGIDAGFWEDWLEISSE